MTCCDGIMVLGAHFDACLCGVDERPVEDGRVAAIPMRASSKGLLGPKDTTRWYAVARLDERRDGQLFLRVDASRKVGEKVASLGGPLFASAEEALAYGRNHLAGIEAQG